MMMSGGSGNRTPDLFCAKEALYLAELNPQGEDGRMVSSDYGAFYTD
jgi:hypothetical protein